MYRSGPGFTYLLLVIPSLIAFTVAAQGFSRMRKRAPGGQVMFGFGIFFFLLIAAGYYFFIR